MYSYLWPITLVIISNIVYQICAKEVPSSMHPLASLTLTYIVGAIVSAILYYALNKEANLLQEYTKTNWAPFLLGLVIVGLEVGYIYAYKVGWFVNNAFLVQSVIVAIGLLLVGFFLYKESITYSKLLGLLICLIGLYFMNK